MNRIFFLLACCLAILPRQIHSHVEIHEKSMRLLMIQTLYEIKIAIEFVPEKAKLVHLKEENQSLFKQKGARLSRWMSENPNVKMFQGSDPVLVRIAYEIRDLKVELKENLKHIVENGFCHEVSGWEKDAYFIQAPRNIDKIIAELQKMPDPISASEIKNLKHKVEQQFIPLVLF